MGFPSLIRSGRLRHGRASHVQDWPFPVVQVVRREP